MQGSGETVISIKDKQYVMSKLPKEVQDLISVYKLWESELTSQKVEVFKTEAALKSVSKEIEIRMEAHELRVAPGPKAPPRPNQAEVG